MIPEVGTTCKFFFKPKFATLDGVYRIRAETTFQDALISGVNFVDNLYTPAGLASVDFNSDSDGYLKDRIAVLESVYDNSVVYYTPESIFQYYPDPTVNEYYPLILVTDLGVQKNTQAIYPLLDQIKDLIKAALGTSDPLRIITNPENKVYLTDQEYDTLVTAREVNITGLVPLSVQLRAALAANTVLAAKVAAYEALIIQTAHSDS